MSELQANENALGRIRDLLRTVLPHGLPSGTVLLAGVLVAWFSWPILASLLPVWETDYYSHGHVALVATLVLFALELRRAPFPPFAPSWLGFACLVGLAAVAIVGYASTTILISQQALPLIWMAAIWSLAGAEIARRFVLPLGYLYVALPAWDVLLEPSRRLTVLVETAWIRAAGLPAFIEGDTIHVPAGSFQVQGGCGGLKYILVSLSLAALTSLVQRRRWIPSVALIGAAVALALVANWLRVFITVLSGLSPENWAAVLVNEYHLSFGWGLFLVAVVLPLVYIDRLIQPGPAPSAAPEGSIARPQPKGTSGGAAAVLTCAALALGVWIVHRIDGVLLAQPSAAGALPLTIEVAGWDRGEEWQDSRLPIFVGARTQAAWYRNGQARIGAFVAHYASQRQDQEVVYAHNLPAGQAGVIAARTERSVELASGASVTVQELEIADSATRRRLAWVALRIAGQPAASDLVAKLLQVAGVVRGRSDAQAVVLTADCDRSCEDARSWLAEYAAAALEPLFEQAERSSETRAQSPEPQS